MSEIQTYDKEYLKSLYVRLKMGLVYEIEGYEHVKDTLNYLSDKTRELIKREYTIDNLNKIATSINNDLLDIKDEDTKIMIKHSMFGEIA